jgi:Zn-dependent M28 family amino/carboxypeptidase
MLPETIEHRLRCFSRSNWTREEELRRIFEEAGCSGSRLSEQRVAGGNPPNVACRLPGRTDATIIVGAHSDLRGGGQGVLDNWSGAALLPSLFQSLRGAAPRHTFIFVGFSAEEHHRKGSKFYMKHLSPQEAGHIRAMVNLDCLGAGSAAVWTHHADPELLSALYDAARESSSSLRNVDLVLMYDDAMSFRKHGIPTLSLHSLTRESVHALHSRRDNLSVIDLDSYYASYRLIAAYLVHLDSALE